MNSPQEQKRSIPWPSWLTLRVIIKLLVIAILVLVVYFTVREDSNFSSVPWLPKVVKRFLHKNVYLRNLWGFLPVGLIFGGLFDVSVLFKKSERKQRLLWISLLFLPIAKEIAQIPLPNRHCNGVGMLAGVIGLMLGLLFGHLIKKGIRFIALMAKPETPSA
jgi:hypothetical protein